MGESSKFVEKGAIYNKPNLHRENESNWIAVTLLFSSIRAACLQGGCQMEEPVKEKAKNK